MKKLLMLLPLALVVFAFRTPETVKAPEIPADVKPLLEKYGCVACHTMDKKLVGPKWPEIAAKKYSVKRIVALVKNPEPANWPGYPPMAAQPTVPKKDLEKIAGWLVALK